VTCHIIRFARTWKTNARYTHN